MLLNPPPPPICRNTPVSNTLFDLEDKENQRFKDFYEDDETLNAMTDPEVDKMITGLEDTDEEMAASKTAIMDKMHESQVHYDKIFLEFEKNKRAMGKWSNKDPRWERNMYAEAAMRLASDFIEGTSKTLPKWRSDLTDQGHDKLINDWNGALSHIRMLADRLNMAQTLLKHSIMDDRLRAKVLED